MSNYKKNLPQTKDLSKMNYEAIVERSTEANVKSKHRASTGIDLVTKGTINKSKAEKLLSDARELAVSGESLKVRGNEILTDSKNLEVMGLTTREEYNAIMLEVDITYRKYIELKKAAELKLEMSENSLQDSEMKFTEGSEYVNRGQILVDKANSLLQEANILNENAIKWIQEGNKLIETAKEETNAELRNIRDFSPENFTLESSMRAIPDLEVEPDSFE